MAGGVIIIPSRIKSQRDVLLRLRQRQCKGIRVVPIARNSVKHIIIEKFNCSILYKISQPQSTCPHSTIQLSPTDILEICLHSRNSVIPEIDLAHQLNWSRRRLVDELFFCPWNSSRSCIIRLRPVAGIAEGAGQ